MKYVIYYRVSTAKQGISGLGLEAQKQQVEAYLAQRQGVEIVSEYVEVDSGKKATRIELAKAVADAKRKTRRCY